MECARLVVLFYCMTWTLPFWGGLFIHKNLALGSANRYVEDETCTKPNDQTSIFDSKSNIFGWVEDPGNISEVKSYDHFDVARRIVYAYD